MSIQEWLEKATLRLNDAAIPSARLDAELLLAYVLKKPREYNLAHSEKVLTPHITAQLDELLKRRGKREPIAYITGSKEFYGRNFIVTPDVLIPRPESEVIIEHIKKRSFVKGDVLIDVGTGSGSLAITAKLEAPDLAVVAVDNSLPALRIARKNARALQADIAFQTSDLFHDVMAPRATVVIANLPYVDTAWPVSPETAYEPQQALFAENNGLGLIEKLLVQLPNYLKKNGFLCLEADPRQHEKIIALARPYGLVLQEIEDFVLSFQAT